MPVNPLAVEGTDVVLRYDGTIAVDTSDFQVPAGQVTAVIGPNGSGKSTLLNGIAGLLQPLRGTITVHALHPSYVLQSTRVNESLPITVREVVTMGRYPTVGAYGRLRSADRDAVDRAMTRMGITHLSHRHLHDLSGGQRQRVFIAQGLAEDHDLLLFDEPLTGLDLPSAKVIDEVIHEEPQRGHTVVLTTHDLSEAGQADNVILMGGRVVSWGPPAEVLASDNLIAAYGPGLLHMEAGQIFIDDPAHLEIRGGHNSGT